jgi:hypothetical protein
LPAGGIPPPALNRAKYSMAAPMPLAPSPRFDRLQVIIAQLHRQRGVSWPVPAIALNAADQPLAVVVDLDQRAMAVRAFSGASF